MIRKSRARGEKNTKSTHPIPKATTFMPVPRLVCKVQLENSLQGNEGSRIFRKKGIEGPPIHVRSGRESTRLLHEGFVSSHLLFNPVPLLSLSLPFCDLQFCSGNSGREAVDTAVGGAADSDRKKARRLGSRCNGAAAEDGGADGCARRRRQGGPPPLSACCLPPSLGLVRRRHRRLVQTHLSCCIGLKRQGGREAVPAAASAGATDGRGGCTHRSFTLSFVGQTDRRTDGRRDRSRGRRRSRLRK